MDKEKNKMMKSSDGIMIRLDDQELVIKGNPSDLIEFSQSIMNLALSNEKKDHIHLDELTLIDSHSDILHMIIEKE